VTTNLFERPFALSLAAPFRLIRDGDYCLTYIITAVQLWISAIIAWTYGSGR